MPDDSSRPRKNIRLPRFRYEQADIVSLTICTANRTPLFKRENLCQLLNSHLPDVSSDMQMHLLCYVIMPDHVHALISSAGEDSILKWVRRLKGHFSREAGLLGVSPPIWQRSFFDHFLRENEHPLQTMQYILENPQRAGLVKHWWEYPWSWDFQGLKEEKQKKKRAD